MKIKLLRNLAAPWGCGFAGDVLHTPQVPEATANELIRRGFAQLLPDVSVEPAGAPAADNQQKETKP